MGTSGQRIRLFYYTRYRGLGQLVFALQYENLQPRPRVLRILCPAAAEQKQAQKSTRYPGKSLCLFYLFGQERIHRAGARWIATGRTGGVSRGGAAPLALGFQ